MDKIKQNARSLTPSEKYLLRKNVVRLLQNDKKPREIVAILDVSRSYVYTIKKTFDEKGIEGIKPRQQGRKIGTNRKLTSNQETEIRNAIIDKNPEQLKLPGCMWCRSNIRELIERKYKIKIALSTLGYYLQRWGFSVQRPRKKAAKQDSAKVEKWLRTEFPGISQRAERENAEIFFGDETGVQNTANFAKGYAPIGQTPVLEIEPKKMKINMLSAISNRGKLRFIIYKDTMNSNKFIDFCSRLITESKKKVFFIVDNLRVHHSKKVIAWLDKHKTRIEVFYLPPYAPEYNPDELLNADMKRNIGNRAMPRTESDLEHNMRSYLKTLQLRPKKICSFFDATFTKYAQALSTS